MDEARRTFGPFALDRTRGMLLRDGEPIAVGQRGLAVLEALLAAEGAIVGKAALLERAWPGIIVEEGNLPVQIASLRKALGARSDGQQWIVTVPRLGYRLPWDSTEPLESHSQLPSLAVLPFANLSGDPEQDYLADGLVEDIITALSRFISFAVIARNSSFVYKSRAVDVRQVAEDLGVRYVLEGSVRRAGDRLRISAQLIDGSSGAHLWAENFDGAFEDVFEVQDRITESVVGQVAPQIQLAEIGRSRRKRPENLTAYDLYLRALQKVHTAQPEDNKEALAFLMRAIAIEPNYAVALASAAKTLKFRSSMGWPQFTADDRTLCLDLARRALPDADGDATVLAQCGLILVSVGRDYDRGMLVLQQAVEANPNNLTALICAGVCNIHCGSFADSLAFSHRAILLSPGDPTQYWPLTAIAHAHMALGNFVEALQWAERSLAVNPRYDPTHWMLISANAQLGRLDDARRLLAVFEAIAPGVTVASIEAGQAANDPARLRPILDGLRLAGMPEG